MSESEEMSRRAGGGTLRISGKFFSIENIIDGVEKNPVTPTNMDGVGAAFIFAVLVIALNFMGCRIAGIGAVVTALIVHELGHFLGMKLVGWSSASISFGLFGPIAIGTEGVSGGRKAVVALSGPALGLLVGLLLSVLSNPVESGFAFEVARSSLFFAALNLIPIRPFDGAFVVDHLLFARHPRLQIAFLIMVGSILFLIVFRGMYHEARPFFSVFFGLYMTITFMQIKKVDNTSEMIVRLRRDALDDYEKGRYSAGTIKKLEFSLSIFELTNEVSAALFLREIWDKAWEITATGAEIIMVVLIYLLLIFGCIESAMLKEMGAGILPLAGLS